jgi:hypothetical protein
MVFLCFVVSCESLKLAQDLSSDPKENECTKLYLDIGSNLGVQVRKLFEPKQYPEAQIHAVFNEYFGNPDIRNKRSAESGICAIGFEANPAWKERLKSLEKTYQKHGWNAQFFVPRVVSDVDNENITFYVDNVPEHNDWGASISSGQASASHAGSNHRSVSSQPYAVIVQTLDISKFIRSTVLPRVKQAVVAKIDIEGAEYIILPKMLKAGLLCKGKVDSAFIEWHPSWQGGGHRKKGYLALKKHLLQQIQSAKYCQGANPTTMLEVDDESYGHDGIPLPAFSVQKSNVTNIKEITKAIYAASAQVSSARQAESS